MTVSYIFFISAWFVIVYIERSVNTVDPCSIDNGGCVHVCTSDAFGEHVCSCKPGYRLTRKGKCLGKAN